MLGSKTSKKGVFFTKDNQMFIQSQSFKKQLLSKFANETLNVGHSKVNNPNKYLKKRQRQIVETTDDFHSVLK